MDVAEEAEGAARMADDAVMLHSFSASEVAMKFKQLVEPLVAALVTDKLANLSAKFLGDLEPGFRSVIVDNGVLKQEALDVFKAQLAELASSVKKFSRDVLQQFQMFDELEQHLREQAEASQHGLEDELKRVRRRLSAVEMSPPKQVRRNDMDEMGRRVTALSSAVDELDTVP